MTTDTSPEGAQDEALRLAHALDGGKLIDDSTEWADTLDAAAAALRRLHARVQEQQAELTEQARLLGISAEREMALRARVQELERERDNYKLAYDEWCEKTEWVQKTVRPGELGMHRADALRERIERAVAAEREACAAVCDEAAEAFAHMAKNADKRFELAMLNGASTARTLGERIRARGAQGESNG